MRDDSRVIVDDSKRRQGSDSGGENRFEFALQFRGLGANCSGTSTNGITMPVKISRVGACSPVTHMNSKLSTQ